MATPLEMRTPASLCGTVWVRKPVASGVEYTVLSVSGFWPDMRVLLCNTDTARTHSCSYAQLSREYTELSELVGAELDEIVHGYH